MAYLEELLPEFRNGAKIRLKEWDKDFYIHIKSGRCWDERGARFSFQIDDLMSGNWEFFKEPEPDWQKIIDNKSLCWFWDYDEVNKIMGFLTGVNENNTLCRFTCRTSAGNSYSYACCRPVRRDEVTFYEDKEDEI